MFKKRKQLREEQAEWMAEIQATISNLEYQMEQLAWALGLEWDPLMVGVSNYTRDSEVRFGSFNSGSYRKIGKGKK